MAFFKQMLSLNLKEFGGANFPIGIVLFFTFVGLIIATIIVQHANRVLYRTIKALHRHKATSEGSAKALESLGLFNDRVLIRAIRAKSAPLMRYLCVAKEDSAAVPDKTKEAREGEEMPAESARYYLNPLMADRAAEILSAKEPTALQTVLYCVLFALVYLGIASILPPALSIIL